MLDSQQKSALDILHRENGGVVWHKVGEGKTRIALSWFAILAKKLTKGNNLLAVVCRRKSFSSWVKEAALITPEFRVFSIEDWTGICTRKTTVLLVSHGMLEQYEEVLKDGRVAAVVYDEGYKFKNARALICKAANRISSEVQCSAIIGGSIMTARNIEDVWGQLFAINRHTRLCSSLTKFRSRYMRKIAMGQVFRFTAKPDSFDRISKSISSFTSIHFPSDRIQAKDMDLEVDPTKQQIDLLNQARDYIFNTQGKITEIKNAVSLIIKVCQISDGFFQTSEGEVVKVEASKMGTLKKLLPRLVSKGQVIIWVAFRETVKQILQELQRDYRCYRMFGGSKFDEEGWANDGQVAVATVGSGDSVNFFKNCSNVIYYSRDCKLLSDVQSRGRSMRKDSTHDTCRFYHLFTRGTMDYKIRDLVKKSKCSEEELKGALRKWAKEK